MLAVNLDVECGLVGSRNVAKVKSVVKEKAT